jgi:hypothetical protein
VNRPTEATSAIVAVVTAAVTLFGLNLSDDQFSALIVLVGFVPSVVTWLVVKLRPPTR